MSVFCFALISILVGYLIGLLVTFHKISIVFIYFVGFAINMYISMYMKHMHTTCTYIYIYTRIRIYVYMLM